MMMTQKMSDLATKFRENPWANIGEDIYPDGKQNDWYWHYAQVVDIPEEEREQYDGHSKRLDVENPQIFGQFEFMKACTAMGIVKDMGPEE